MKLAIDTESAMTGPRELTALQAQRALHGSSSNERVVAALESLAVSVAAIADLYEFELACMGAPDVGDDAGDEARVS